MEINYKYAGFWRRFSALIIDYAIVGIISLLLTLWFIHHTLGPLLFIGIIAGFSFIFFFSLIFPTICLIYRINPITSKWQGTLGKRIMGIYVINRDGTKLTKIKMVGRSVFVYIIPFGSFVYLDKPLFSLNVINIIICIGFIISAFTSKKIALHDMIFKTYVIRGKL